LHPAGVSYQAENPLLNAPVPIPIPILLQQIAGCTTCSGKLPNLPRPIVAASATARLLILSQAPGAKVHKSGVPWDDASGKLLRSWLQMTEQSFYDSRNIAIMPLGFCYPGKGTSGDLPPRPECAPQWHPQLIAAMPQVRLTLLIGSYAQAWYLRDAAGKNLTETVARFRSTLPQYLPLPHPSPRNRFWFKRNPWFETELLPVLRQQVARALHD
jgi:uracil-DNA glycosylase